MKKTFLATIFALVTIIPALCASVKPPKLSNSLDSLSYALGYLTGHSLHSEYPEVSELLDYKIYGQGLNDGATDGRWMDPDALLEYITTTFEAANRIRYARNIEEGERFLAENRLDPEVHVTDSGLQYRIISPGSGEGERPREYDDMTLTYSYKTLDGAIYNSGTDEQTYPASEIDGLTEGTMMMSPGAKYVFYIPADLAYGGGFHSGAYGEVEPWSMIIAEVEMITMTRDDDYYSGSREEATPEVFEGTVREAGDYTATVLARISQENVAVNGYSPDQIVRVYEAEGFRIVLTGDRIVVFNGEGQEVFRSTLDEESNNYRNYFLTEYRREGDDSRVFLVLDMGAEGGRWYGAMLYVVENGVFSQPEGYMALTVGGDGANGQLSPVLKAYNTEAGVEFKADAPYVSFFSLTKSNLTELTGDDLWYVYSNGKLTKAGPAAALGYFRENGQE